MSNNDDTYEVVATYIYEKLVEYGMFQICAMYQSEQDYNKRKVNTYAIYDMDGNYLNEDEILTEMPTWEYIFKNYWLPIMIDRNRNDLRDVKNASR
jgi:hypothetical protein